MTEIDSDGSLSVSEGGRFGGRSMLVVAVLIAALVLGATAFLTSGAPRSHLSTLATAAQVSAPSAASLAASRGVGSDERGFWVARSRNGLLARNGDQKM